MRLPGFIGPTYQTRSKLADNQAIVNLYPERVESGMGENEWVYYTTPGRSTFVTLGDAPLHQLYTINDRTFAIAGTTLYELHSNGTATSRGTVASGSRTPTMASNGEAGNQLFIVAGLKRYIFALDTNTLTEVVTAFDIAQGAFADGYFLALIDGGLSFQISALENGLTWDATDLGVRSQQADNLKAFIVDHQYLWLLGAQTSEVWENTGEADFPYAPVPSIFLEVGIWAADSLCHFDGSIAWVGTDKHGARMVFRADGFNPMRISDHAIETAMQAMTTSDDAFAYSYQEAGHTFLVITFPTANQTWVYDAASLQWHTRGTWNAGNGSFDRDRGSCYTFAFGKHLVGDNTTGVVHEQSLDIYADGAIVRRWLRRSPHLTTENLRMLHRRFELKAEVGVGTPSDVFLRWSDDGGHTWSTAQSRSLGASAAYATRVIWNNLGQARDRVYEVYGSDPVKIALIDAFVTVDRCLS